MHFSCFEQQLTICAEPRARVRLSEEFRNRGEDKQDQVRHPVTNPSHLSEKYSSKQTEKSSSSSNQTEKSRSIYKQDQLRHPLTNAHLNKLGLAM